MADSELFTPQPFDAMGPSGELHTEGQWKTWLQINIPDFTGNIDQAGTLMACFSQGREYVLREFTRRGLKNISAPHVVILLRESQAVSVIGATNQGRDVYIKRSYLEECSNYDLTSIGNVARKADRTVLYEGTIADMFRLAGVEETHHSVFAQIKPDEVEGIDPATVSVPQYDAREDEYRALKWQIRFAKKRNMPEVTINLLQRRFEAASKLRRD